MLEFRRYAREAALPLFVMSFPLLMNLRVQDRSPDRTAHVSVAKIAPRLQDVTTLDGILSAFYEVISGPAGQQRQWSRDRTLYIPGVLFIPTLVGKDGKPEHKIMNHQELADAYNSSLVSGGFYEQEIHRITTRYGTIAHVLSTYVMRRTPNGPPIGRGVNSIELFYDGKRWWIVCNLWDEEREGNPLPKDLLP